MTSLLLLIPIAVGVSLVGLVGFLWALRSGQFEDLEGAAARILIEDEADDEDESEEEDEAANDV